ncbi:putative transcriptional regulator [Rhizobium leguminosarum bv. trifolii WSM2304]|uniref:Transcriptional regulator n=1 Tax=Rhizobium leguminosarum bv. trifolii (strain WSM2304) TaxID=395492 RepID=A0ABF7QI01_RHILW|nr:ATP-binding protein [Rhizobium leguminosarum]ACI53482.1 putative transcriptional regulator [Rhizobium leguminosarum bv. trifolii WSM2304]
MFQTQTLNQTAVQDILTLDESHFIDFKAIEIAPAKLTKTISAFANTSGGEVYIGISEVEGEDGKTVEWRGFDKPESANAIVQVLENLGPLANNYMAEFLRSETEIGYVLHLTVLKTQDIIIASDGKVYVRRSAQSLPVGNDAALERLRYEKGIKSFEDEILNEGHKEISNSNTVLEFLLETIPTGEPEDWLSKQRVLVDSKPTVAGILLFSDNPQSILPKRSAIKILRYQTKKEAERDFLAFDPLTMEGPLYNLIYDSVDKVKEIIEGIEKLGADKMEKVSYPQDALHELLTNAVLHRDYNIAADVQVKIFDNRIEIESPGRLPGHVTPKNIRKTQFARNPKIVRLINKFRNPPNKDVGEGLNTAFEAMGKLRLKPPVIEEREGYVVVTLRHESLGSPEQMVMDYLKDESEITNLIARELTGIKSENSMKSVFYRLRETGQLEQVPKVAGKKPAWRIPLQVSAEPKDNLDEAQ